MFTSAVSTAATGMLTVCAYVIFFSAITGALGSMMGDGSGSGIGEMGYTLFYGFLELTGGISEAATLTSWEPAIVLTAAIAGWSGLSVHCQVLTLCGGRGLSFRPYLFAKAAQGVLCAGVMTLLLRFGDPVWFSPNEDAIMEAIMTVTSWKEITVPAMVTDIAFVTGWIVSRVRGWRQ